MRAPALKTAGSKAGRRRSRTRRYVLLAIASLAVVSGVALSIWAIGPPLSWTADYDKVSYARIINAIAADPRHLGGRRLYDVSRELGIEGAPWDDGNVQNLPGSYRIYHFRGLALYMSLEYMGEGLTQNMLLERGSPEERLQGRDLLRIHTHIPPFVIIDGISGRAERMRQYWARQEEAIEEINKKMKSEQQRGLNQQD